MRNVKHPGLPRRIKEPGYTRLLFTGRLGKSKRKRQNRIEQRALRRLEAECCPYCGEKWRDTVDTETGQVIGVHCPDVMDCGWTRSDEEDEDE